MIEMRAWGRAFATATLAVLLAAPAFAAPRKKSAPAAASKPKISAAAEIKQRYFALRNTDPSIAKVDEWLSMAAALGEFAALHPHDEDAPFCLYHGALAYHKAAGAGAGASFDDRAVELIEALLKDHARSALADDALILKGDIYWDRDSKRKAIQTYRVVTDRYAESDMYPLALERLGVRPSATPEPASAGDHRGPKIVIDPGHGGEDDGAVGPAKLLEKEVTLDVALELEKILVAERDADVRLTRRGDNFVPLLERTKIANDVNADLFISLHTNASPKGNASGLETFYLDNTNDAASRLLADRENQSGSIKGADADLQFILSDLIQSAKLGDSVALAKALSQGVMNRAKQVWPHAADLGVRKGPFYVLVGAHMPCVLIELFFIDNRGDAAKLSDPAFRKRVARGLADGVMHYLDRSKRSGARS